MSYLGEFRANLRPLVAACIGLGFGFSCNSYVLSPLAPFMLKGLGWSTAQFATATSMSLLTLIAIPGIGRITDLIGTRRMAAVGIVSLPLSYIAISLMTGPFWQYLAIYGFQSFFCIATTTTVYSRAIAGRFVTARGLAFSILASTTALIGAVAAPLISRFAVAYGWRTSFRLVAALALVGGVTALLLLPSDADRRAARPASRRTAPLYGPLFRRRAFWILTLAILLCNLPSVLYLSQISLMMIRRGVEPTVAATMLSTFALSNVFGRFATGLLLDRFPMRIVAAVTMSIPAVGFALLVAGASNIVLLHACVFLIGMTFGAEGDLLPYITVHTFGFENYSSIYGLFTAVTAAGIMIGSIILGATLHATGNFTTFLALSGCWVLIGGLMFLLVSPRERYAAEPVPADEPELSAI